MEDNLNHIAGKYKNKRELKSVGIEFLREG